MSKIVCIDFKLIVNTFNVIAKYNLLISLYGRRSGVPYMCTNIEPYSLNDSHIYLKMSLFIYTNLIKRN